MKNNIFIIVAVLLLASCKTVENSIIPRAVNTVNSVALKELNLERNNYEIINTVQAEASILYIPSKDWWSGKTLGYSIADSSNEFRLEYRYDVKKGWSCNFNGVMRFGYLANDYEVSDNQIYHPEEISRRLAIYRLINLVNENGADGVLEPVISTNVESKDGGYIFSTTVKAKLVVLKNDR